MDVMKTIDFDFILTDYDIYLFNQGNLFELYDKLGSHLSTNRSRAGVHFAVWAPNAAAVSVAGSFNSWSEEANPMVCRHSCGVWELFIPALDEGVLYKFYIRTREGALLEKADPFAQYHEHRPSNASIVYAHEYEWGDDEFTARRRSFDPRTSPVSIYEVHAGSWKRHADGSYLSYRELAAQLPDYAAQCGFTHIEFLPLMEHPFDGSWGYQVTGYFAATSRFGTPDDLKYLVDMCHRRNIGVIFDWVPAHFPSDAFGLYRFDGTPLFEYADPQKGFHPEWNTYVFDYTKPIVRNFLIASALYWLSTFHGDGIRVDAVASMLYLDYARNSYTPNIHGGKENLEAVLFLRSLSREIAQRHRGVIFAAEESTAWPRVTEPADEGGLGFGFKWNMGWMHDFLEYISLDPPHKHSAHHKLVFSMKYAYSERYILPLSHDEVVHCKRPLIGKMPGNDTERFSALRASYAFMFTHPGKKLLFMGGEIAQKCEWNHDTSIAWHELGSARNAALHRFFTDLNRLYSQKKALYEMDYERGGFEWVIRNDNGSPLIAFLRRGRAAHDMLLVVINFSPQMRHGCRVGVPIDCFWKEILNSDAALYGGADEGNKGGFVCESVASNNMDFSLCLTVPACGALIFEPVQS